MRSSSFFAAAGRGFEPVKRYDVAMSETWAQPTISGSRLFVKDISPR